MAETNKKESPACVGSANGSADLLREVMAYHHGEGKYDFSGVRQPYRDQAAFDAWQDLRQRIAQHLSNNKVSNPGHAPIIESK